jgi:hypothetical protein
MATKKQSASVSKTSGQGISRKAYQQGRSRLAKTAVDSPKVAGFSAADSSSGRQYGKAKGGDYPEGINVSYGNTFEPTDLKDLTAMGKGAPPKGFKNARLKAKDFK